MDKHDIGQDLYKGLKNRFISVILGKNEQFKRPE